VLARAEILILVIRSCEVKEVEDVFRVGVGVQARLLLDLLTND
jgi:hypothetical protein